MAPGHPLLEALNEYILNEIDTSSREFSVFVDPDNEKKGVLWFVEGEVIEGSGDPAGKRIFSVFEDEEGQFRQVNASVLWDLKPVEDAEIPPGIQEIIQKSESVDEFVLDKILIPYKEEIQERRDRSAEIKEKYGLQSINKQIYELEEKNYEFQQRVDQGETEVKGQITKNERKIRDLERKKERLEEEIKHEKNLTVSAPNIIGATIVLPMKEAQKTDGKGPGMVSDQEIEQVGMDVAMEYERENGRDPEEVAEENLGFDVRSWEVTGEEKEVARYIEVKARAQVGKVSLTPNEWIKAERFEENYWLYIVSQAGTDSPELKTIQNPTQKFDPDEIVEVKRYEIPPEKWQEEELQEA